MKRLCIALLCILACTIAARAQSGAYLLTILSNGRVDRIYFESEPRIVEVEGYTGFTDGHFFGALKKAELKTHSWITGDEPKLPGGMWTGYTVWHDVENVFVNYRGDFSVLLYTKSGKFIRRIESSIQVPVNFSDLPSGDYIIEVTSGSNVINIGYKYPGIRY